MEVLANFFGNVSWEDIITSCLRIVMVLLLTWLAMKILRIFVSRLERNLLHESRKEGEPPTESQKRIETITRLVKQGLLLALWVTAAMVILQELGVEVGPILASAGIAGVALGFGAQNLVRDIIAGFFIILENQIRVGDVAVINDTGGLVEKINFRTTVLRALDGSVHVFPNGAIEKLANMTNEWSAYVFDLRVAYKENTDKVVEIVREVGRKLLAEDKYKVMMLGEPEIFGVDTLGESGVIIKGRLRTKPIRQWDVGREFLRRIKFAFDASGIEHAFPHRSLYLGESTASTPGLWLDKLGLQASAQDAERPSVSSTSKDPASCIPTTAGEGDTAFSEKEIRKVDARARPQKIPDAEES